MLKYLLNKLMNAININNNNIVNNNNNIPNQESKYYKILKWNAVAMWVYDTYSETCSICKNSLTEPCITCQANADNNDQKYCKRVIGKCNHCYHTHCIDEWLKKQANCPLDGFEWVSMKFD